MSHTPPKGGKSSPKSERPKSEKPKSEAKRKESKKGTVGTDEGAVAKTSRKNTIKSKKDAIASLKDSESAQGGTLVDAPVAKKEKAPVNTRFAAAAKKKAAQKKIAPPKANKKLGTIGRFLMTLGIGGYDIHVTNEFAIEAVRALGLQQKHLRRMKKRFDDIDLDGTGTIDTVEFLVR
jgi:hypothetical protein